MKALIINCVSDRPEIQLYLRLKALGLDFDLLVDPRETRVNELRAAGIPTEILHIRHRFDLSAIRILQKKFSSTHYDVVYAPTSRGITTSLLASRKLAQKPAFVSYRGTMGNLSFYNPLCRLAHLHPRVDRIVCNCQAVKQFLLSIGVSEAKLPVVYKGHLPEWYKAEEKVADLPFSQDDDTFLIACVAKIRPLKGVDTLIQAFNRLAEERDVRLLLVGECVDKNVWQLAEQSLYSDRIHFLGHREDVPALLKHCSVSVMPSLRREGVARAVVESLALGVPAVVSNVGGLPEIVEHEKNGLVFRAGDVEDLSKALKRLTDSPEFLAKLSSHAPLILEEKLAMDTYVRDMLQVFEDACKEKAKAA